MEGVVGDDGDGLGVGFLALAAGGQAQADGAGGGSGEQGAAAEGRVGPAGAVGGLDAHVCLLDGSPEGPATTCGAPGRWSRLPSPVLTGAGSRVCGLPHSQRRRRRPVGQWRPGRRRGAPLSLQVNCSSRAPADTNSIRPAPRAGALPLHPAARSPSRAIAFPRDRRVIREVVPLTLDSATYGTTARRAARALAATTSGSVGSRPSRYGRSSPVLAKNPCRMTLAIESIRDWRKDGIPPSASSCR